MGTVTSPAELKVMPKQITAMANDGTGWFLLLPVFLMIFSFNLMSRHEWMASVVYDLFHFTRVVIKPPVTSVLPPVTDQENHGYASVHHHKNNKFHRGKHNKRRKHKGQGKR